MQSSDKLANCIQQSTYKGNLIVIKLIQQNKHSFISQENFRDID